MYDLKPHLPHRFQKREHSPNTRQTSLIVSMRRSSSLLLSHSVDNESNGQEYDY